MGLNAFSSVVQLMLVFYIYNLYIFQFLWNFDWGVSGRSLCSRESRLCISDLYYCSIFPKNFYHTIYFFSIYFISHIFPLLLLSPFCVLSNFLSSCHIYDRFYSSVYNVWQKFLHSACLPLSFSFIFPRPPPRGCDRCSQNLLFWRDLDIQSSIWVIRRIL